MTRCPVHSSSELDASPGYRPPRRLRCKSRVIRPRAVDALDPRCVLILFHFPLSILFPLTLKEASKHHEKETEEEVLKEMRERVVGNETMASGVLWRNKEGSNTHTIQQRETIIFPCWLVCLFVGVFFFVVAFLFGLDYWSVGIT